MTNAFAQVDGVFSADQHPGNVLLMPDGRLGLIDFGQVKEMTEEHRYKLARMMVALARDDRPAVVEEMLRMGFRTKHMAADTIFLHAAFNFDRDTQDITGDRNIQQFMEHLNQVDPIQHLPSEYVMAARCTILLRGLGTLLAKPLSIATLWEPYATRFIKDFEARQPAAAAALTGP